MIGKFEIKFLITDLYVRAANTLDKAAIRYDTMMEGPVLWCITNPVRIYNADPIVLLKPRYIGN